MRAIKTVLAAAISVMSASAFAVPIVDSGSKLVWLPFSHNHQAVAFTFSIGNLVPKDVQFSTSFNDLRFDLRVLADGIEVTAFQKQVRSVDALYVWASPYYQTIQQARTFELQWSYEFDSGAHFVPSLDTGCAAISCMEIVRSVPSVAVQVTAVPEPSTYLLMALGLVGIGAISVRSRGAK